jgi:glucose-6-phosphate 1-dehydrogenase
VLAGDASLFARSDEVELAWRIIDPILAGWRSAGVPMLAEYETGLWGPEESREWKRRDEREWLDVRPVLA